MRKELVEAVDDLMVRMHFRLGRYRFKAAVVGFAHSMLWFFCFFLGEFGGAGFDVSLLEVLLSSGGP